MGSIEVSLALLSITIAGTGVYFADAAHKLAVKKRQDDLFNLRYKLYEKIRALWVYGCGSDIKYWEAIIPRLNAQEINALPYQASFLFDKQIQNCVFLMTIKLQVLGYPGFEHLKGAGVLEEQTDFPQKLFDKYLKLDAGSEPKKLG